MGANRKTVERVIQRDVPLAHLTTFRIGGPARYFIQPASIEQFGDAIEWAHGQAVPYFVLGGGANVLVHDRGFDGLIIHTGKMKGIEIEGESIDAECGVAVDTLVNTALDHGLGGLEFAAGLPGTVGGALFMNARAYEGEFSTVVSTVRALQLKGKRVREILLHRGELKFSYKRSLFQGEKFYVYSVHFLLSSGDSGALRMRAQEIRLKRQEAGQFVFPNAGCIFKNDYDIGKPTGKIIDELGLKGTRIGDAEVYERHGNFIVNRGSATAHDVYRLILLLESRLEKHLGIRIEREIKLIGPWEQE
jgi:UDP-N-acetylmuramate dehydrogenase